MAEIYAVKALSIDLGHTVSHIHKNSLVDRISNIRFLVIYHKVVAKINMIKMIGKIYI